ncbi:putative Zn-dependent protease [Aquimarina sp. EL_43]|uniref:matrixin family metalloprotease n=1 Tax=unclassified Aquimarina TaxID=2627091 RepID=UPI0018CA6A51|nr:MULTISPECIES: matrixin family metalloprotease [unclassified Aquimarina]MBG6129401.1 putative Zn-dependent protease [Aquimarina sp. EL_35]MBG6150466.1 putative Zn-dependent protease [Aquimarina sp. EL_32]MBG6168226.1 putative Zn-dependent protease [Aquimarina sp. EL_43]
MKTIYKISLVLCCLYYISCKNEQKVEHTNETVEVIESFDYYTNEEFDIKDFVTTTQVDATTLGELSEDTDPFEKFMQRFNSVDIDGFTYYVVEGDLLLDEDQLLEYFYVREHISETLKQSNQLLSNKLVGEVRNGQLVRIQNPTNIKYTIIKSSFDNEENYNKIVTYMKEATQSWSNVCNLKFFHKVEMDGTLRPTDNPEEVDFVVREYPAGGAFIAKAFFPYYSKRRKKILLDPSFYNSGFSPIGVLRHELGHTIGLRHEHIRSGAPADCPSESLENTVNLSDYDPQSVMHYFCGGVGSRELLITEKDSIGIQFLYGPST